MSLRADMGVREERRRRREEKIEEKKKRMMEKGLKQLSVDRGREGALFTSQSVVGSIVLLDKGRTDQTDDNGGRKREGKKKR